MSETHLKLFFFGLSWLSLTAGCREKERKGTFGRLKLSSLTFYLSVLRHDFVNVSSIPLHSFILCWTTKTKWCVENEQLIMFYLSRVELYVESIVIVPWCSVNKTIHQSQLKFFSQLKSNAIIINFHFTFIIIYFLVHQNKTIFGEFF
jgi:hypothetical protein